MRGEIVSRVEQMHPLDVLGFYYLRDSDVKKGIYFSGVADAHGSVVAREGLAGLVEFVHFTSQDFVLESLTRFGKSWGADLVDFGGKKYAPREILELYYRKGHGDLFRRAHLKVLGQEDYFPRKMAERIGVGERIILDNWMNLFKRTGKENLFLDYMRKELNPLKILRIYYRQDNALPTVVQAHKRILKANDWSVRRSAADVGVSRSSFHRFVQKHPSIYSVPDVVGPPEPYDVLRIFYRTDLSREKIRGSLKSFLSRVSKKDLAEILGINERRIADLAKKYKIKSEPTEI